ncbi:MAG TPA: hypothetical protein VK177_01215 [Flavobacteriales bacterium]|nr:hypothetical protein [Flavobacteriales bacterium]
MKTLFKPLIVSAVLLTATTVNAQKFQSAFEYLEYIGKEFKMVQKATWEYTKAAAKNKSAKKIEKTRQELVQTIVAANNKIKRMDGWNGNTAFRDSTVSFLEMNKAVVSYDYEKIMNMEDIAEQSYDLMEAYMKAQDVANEKLSGAGERIETAEKKFAEDNEIKLIEANDKTTLSLKRAGVVMDYYDPIYLIFFKSYKAEAYLLDALNKNDVSGMEQNKSTLAKYAAEGLAQLDAIKPFEGDGSLKKAATELLTFYKDEAEKKFQPLIDFSTTKDGFEKAKKNIETKKEKERTQADIDTYNKMVNEYNKGLNDLNKINTDLNNTRTKLINNWNNAATNFTNKHIN